MHYKNIMLTKLIAANLTSLWAKNKLPDNQAGCNKTTE